MTTGAVTAAVDQLVDVRLSSLAEEELLELAREAEAARRRLLLWMLG